MYRLLPPQDAKYRAMKRAPAAPFLLTLALAGALLGASVARADSPTAARADSPTVAPLVLRRAHGGATFTLTPSTASGGFDAADLETARQAFAWREDDFHSQYPISTHLLDLVYTTMRHFDATQVELLSGYRDGRATSRHTHGRAIDFIVPGVSMTELATYVRTLGFVGVGIYPRSGFVHLDVRNRSYFWLDGTSPGRRSHARQVLASRASGSDSRARARGVAAPFPPNVAADDTEDDEASLDTPEVLEATAPVSASVTPPHLDAALRAPL